MIGSSFRIYTYDIAYMRYGRSLIGINRAHFQRSSLKIFTNLVRDIDYPEIAVNNYAIAQIMKRTRHRLEQVSTKYEILIRNSESK